MADETNYGFERTTILLIEEGHNILFAMDDLPRNMGVGHVMHLTEGDEAINNLKKTASIRSAAAAASTHSAVDCNPRPVQRCI